MKKLNNLEELVNSYLSQQEIATKMGITQGYLSQLKNKKRRCSPEVAFRFERIFGLDARKLLGIEKRK